MTSTGGLTPVLTIEDFPSRNEIIQLLKDYLTESNLEQKYKCANRSNAVSITFENPDAAYGFLKKVNMEKIHNNFYQNVKCSLSFKIQFNKEKYKEMHNKSLLDRSVSTSQLQSTTPKRLLKSNKSMLLKSSKLLKSYEHTHWRSIAEKAGIMASSNSYIGHEKQDVKDYQDGKKKWIGKKNFNVFVGKATSNKNYYIKNYVQMTPSIPPVLYDFRPINKKKWVGKKDFAVC